jgi:hypothetical protein
MCRHRSQGVTGNVYNQQRFHDTVLSEAGIPTTDCVARHRGQGQTARDQLNSHHLGPGPQSTLRPLLHITNTSNYCCYRYAGNGDERCRGHHSGPLPDSFSSSPSPPRRRSSTLTLIPLLALTLEFIGRFGARSTAPSFPRTPAANPGRRDLEALESILMLKSLCSRLLLCYFSLPNNSFSIICDFLQDYTAVRTSTPYHPSNPNAQCTIISALQLRIKDDLSGKTYIWYARDQYWCRGAMHAFLLYGLRAAGHDSDIVRDTWRTNLFGQS